MTAVAHDPIERVLPHSLAAERSVLGAILLRNGAIDEAAEVLAPEDFYREAHRVVFAAMLKLAESRRAIDLITLRESLDASGRLDEVGGPAYIARLVDGMPFSTNVVHYAAIVKEKSTRRTLIADAQQIIESAMDGAMPIDEVVSDAERRIFDAGQRQIVNDLVPSSVMVPRLMPVLEKLIEGKGTGVTGVSTGFADLDRITCGLQPGQLIVLGGRPSQGKTSLAQDIARHVSVHQQLPVAFFSLETSEAGMMLRQLVAEARLDSHRLRSGFVSQSEYGRIMGALGALESAPFYLDESGGLRPMEFVSKCRRMRKRVGLSLAIVDFIQQMKPDKGARSENRQLELSGISGAMKRAAKDLGIPIVVISSLNRDVEKRPDKRPTMADLRESGALESDADVVMLVHRPGAYDQDDPAKQGFIELNIAKQKDLPTGVLRLTWIAESARCENYTEGAA